MKLQITITGDDWSDLELALAEVNRLVQEEYRQGASKNEPGAYSFSVTGEPIEWGEIEDELQARGASIFTYHPLSVALADSTLRSFKSVAALRKWIEKTPIVDDVAQD